MQLLFIGDSLTSGVSDSERLGWPGRICKQLDPQGTKLTAYNLGVRASTSAHIESRWKQESIARLNTEAPALLVFCFGAPDAVKNLPLQQSKFSTQNILGDAKNKYATLFISPPPMIDAEKDERTKILTAEFSQICVSLDIPHLDINSPLRENPDYIKALKESDGVHPNAEGYGIMAGMISKFISPYILPHLS